MKSYNNLFNKMTKTDNIEACIFKASKGKRKYKRIRKYLNSAEKNALKIQTVLNDEKYHLIAKTKCEVNGSSAKKIRIIEKPTFNDLIVQHMIASQLQPIVMHGLYEHSYGSIPGCGVHKAKTCVEKWIRNYNGKKFYVLQLDIKHFYQNIDRTVLFNKLQKVIRDKKFLKLLQTIIFYDKEQIGIPLGFYTSQWFANFYLKDFDHFVKQELKAQHYIRYMDDLVIFDTNKRKLRKIKNAIEKYLNEELNIELKYNWQLYKFPNLNNKHGRVVDFLGFKFFRNKTTIRKSILRSIKRKALKIKKNGSNWYSATQMISYLSWTKCSNVYAWFKNNIANLINIKQLRKKISKHSRKVTKYELVQSRIKHCTNSC